MTFRTSNHKDNQAGVTLMLAVLILSAITAIVFSLATIVVIEIRNAGDNLRTEPALYATLAVTEEALMQYRRNVPANIMNITSCHPTSRQICSVNNVTMLPTQLLEEPSPYVVTVRPNERLVIPMYLPQDFPTNAAYSRVVFNMLQARTNGVLDVTMRETTVLNTVNDTHNRLDEFTTPTWTYTAFSGLAQYEIILDNTGRPNPATMSIETFGPNSTVKGIPYVNEKVLRVLSNYLGLTRTYIVKIPDL